MTGEIARKLIAVARTMLAQGLTVPEEVWSALDTALEELVDELAAFGSAR